MTQGPIKDTINVVNARGLHARAAVAISKLVANRSGCKVIFHHEGRTAATTSVMALMTLGATYGTAITVEVHGAAEAARQIMDDVKELFADRFGEST